MTVREWNLRRNCSLSPRQLAFAFLVLFVLSVLVSGAFLLLHGAWQVFVFAMLEMLGVAFAFLCYARHATDQERIALSDNCLLVERVLAGETLQVRLDPHYTRIVLPKSSRGMIDLEACGNRVAVGRFVTDAKRRLFAHELRQALNARVQTADLHAYAHPGAFLRLPVGHERGDTSPSSAPAQSGSPAAR